VALAPSSSPRPQPRVTPEQRRAREQLMAEDFAALEARADMDPLLVNDALRRLGYRGIGGLRSVNLSPRPEDAYYYGEDRIIEAGSNYFADPVLAHEAGHAGFDFVEDAIAANPELAQRFQEVGFVGRFPVYPELEEAVVEVGDDPEASWNLPRDARSSVFGPEALVGIMEPTIQYLTGVDEAEQARVGRFNDIMQQIAEEELDRLGEPPRAQMQEPGPESLFYREPEPERGIGALFRRMFGRD
jgi:hypothetical protein